MIRCGQLLLALFITLLFLSSCSTLSLEQCKTTNWTTRGYKDAAEGVEPSQFNKYKKQCEKHDITINRDLYFRGYEDGIKIFCTYEKGIEQGESGHRNAKICPEALAGEFNKGHRAGYKVYELREELEQQRRQQEEARARQRNELEDMLAKNQSDSREEQEKRDEEALSRMKECTFDSDCGSKKCGSKYLSIGSASGYVNICE